MKKIACIGCLVFQTVWAQTVVESDEAHYDGCQVHLKGHVYVQDEMGKLHADEAIVDTRQTQEGWEATHVLLLGQVKMINCDDTQFALADHVDIYPDQKMMILEAKPGECVLFLDITKHTQLAAHKVQAQRGETDTVQGFGDVRCVFVAEDLDRLKTQFSWEQ